MGGQHSMPLDDRFPFAGAVSFETANEVLAEVYLQLHGEVPMSRLTAILEQAAEGETLERWLFQEMVQAVARQVRERAGPAE